MDVWSCIVLAVNILFLTAGWLLFQQAKSDLNARASQAPVVDELKELHQSIASLLDKLKSESASASGQLETRCREAKDVLATLEGRIGELRERLEAEAQPSRRRTKPHKPVASQAEPEGVGGDDRERARIMYEMADIGRTPSDIGKALGCSTGEVELVLGLRGAAARARE